MKKTASKATNTLPPTTDENDNSLVAELVALLTPEQKALLRERLAEHAQNIGPIDEFDPECADLQRARFAQWDQLLAPKPKT